MPNARRPFKKLILLLLGAGIGVGAILIASSFIVNSTIEYTSSNDFCISCHEMESTVFQEYKKTIHFNNRVGVRATCSDCHVPHSFAQTIVRKIYAAKDVYHHLLGTIDTPEKFEQHRLKMAQRVWDSMKASGSRECRNCHQFDAMVLESQKLRARKQHLNAIDDGSSCIDCHKGIAHKPVHQQQNEVTNPDEEIELEF